MDANLSVGNQCPMLPYSSQGGGMSLFRWQYGGAWRHNIVHDRSESAGRERGGIASSASLAALVMLWFTFKAASL